MDDIKSFLIKLTTGLLDCCTKPAEPVLNINSRKGMSMPMETIEKIIESTIHKK
jgi:hypothetical protein